MCGCLGVQVHHTAYDQLIIHRSCLLAVLGLPPDFSYAYSWNVVERAACCFADPFFLDYSNAKSGNLSFLSGGQV